MLIEDSAEIVPHSSHTDFRFILPWSVLIGKQASQSTNVIMRFLNLLRDLTFFAPRKKVLLACMAWRLDQFLKSYPFVRDDRCEVFIEKQHSCTTERDGFISVSLVKSRDEANYRLVVRLDNSKAILILSNICQKFTLYSGATLSVSSSPRELHWYKLGFDFLSRHIILSLRGDTRLHKIAMNTLARCVLIEYFATLGWSCFSGCAFGVTYLLYSRLKKSTAQLKQHSDYGVLMDVDWTFVDRDGRHHAEHIHASWIDVIRASRCLKIWRKKLRWVHVKVWCISTKANGKPFRPTPNEKILTIATISEAFDIFGVVTDDVVCSRLDT
ncbi:tRNA splicing endonuclease subunit Sen2 [Perkinsela sp. CCAP 1560/4]|nr:tRNA splicing endonuclease subunit Sen2 [Perkinsela sp. CCAP 1560/4]|eukprot:KNH06229.1 tRNA splicing endonuclease subunit Sen2 [Perkinsela sp. CCAP 1560/4]